MRPSVRPSVHSFDGASLSSCLSRTDCPGGWLPREQILGEAATRRVPSEFLAQDVTVTNPPTLLLLLETISRFADNFDEVRSE